MAIPMHEARLDMDLEQLALHQQVAGILDVHPDSIADWHINRIRDDGAIDAEVPLTTIDVEGVPTDPRNVEELIKRFDKYEQEVGGTGQRDAVVIGHVPGEAFYMVDGFHRHEVQTLRGKPALHATVEPNLTYEQVVKRRLEYARTHAEIEFARQVDWIQSAWERTPMSEQIPNVLTAFRAFQEDYAHYKTDDVEQIDALSEQEYATVCEWVAQSSRDWGYTPREIRENLARAESFDPELMQLVYQKKGVPPEGRIGLGHVEAITETYPGEFDFQQEIVSMVIDHQLSVAQTKILIDKIEAHSPSTLANLQKVVKGIDISNIRAEGRTKYSSRGSSTGKAKVDTDYGLLNAIRGRLDDMQTAALEENRWATPEANAALDVIVGLSVIIVGLSEADEPVIDQKALHEAATIFDRLAKDLGKLSLSPETPQDINKKRHEAWGLTFKEYDDEIAPRVIIDGKSLFDLDDTASAILLAVAQQTPGSEHTTEEIKSWLVELGFSSDDKPALSEAAVRSAIHTIDKKLKSLDKQNHVIMHTGGQRKVRFGLIDN